MPIPLQKAREIVFLLIYSYDFAKTYEDAISLIAEELKVSKKSIFEALSKAEKIQKELPVLDRAIAEASAQYDFQRIPYAERNILRLSTYELLFEKDLPYPVVISEGIRLTRKFASFEAASFVNAILDAILKKEVLAQDKEAHAPEVPNA